MTPKNHPLTKLAIYVIMAVLLLVITFSHAASDSLQPFDHFGGYPGGSAVKGDYAYLIQAATITVLDITGTEFKRISYLSLPEEPMKIFIENNTAYLFFAGSDTGIRIMDISNPRMLKQKSALAMAVDFSSKVFVANERIYLASGDTLKIFEAANPEAVVLKSATAIRATAVFVRRHLAYVGGTDGLRILNVADPKKPKQLGYLATAKIDELCVQDNQALLMGYRSSAPYVELIVANVADSTKPAQSAKLGINHGYTAFNGRITSAPGTAYLGVGNKLYLIDISTPSNPVQKGQYQHVKGAFQSLNLAPPFLYAAMGTSDYGFAKIDIAHIDHPALVTALLEPWDVTHMYGWGTTLWVASAEHLMAYDYADPSHPVLMGADSRWPQLVRIFVEGFTLYALASDTLQLIDIADPAHIRAMGAFRVPTGERAAGLSAYGSYAYLVTVNYTTNQSKLYILDVSNPLSIAMKGSCSFPGQGRDIFVSFGETACIAFYQSKTNQGVHVIDVRDPLNPLLKGTGQTHGTPLCVWVTDSLAFVGSNTSTPTTATWYIETFNIANSTLPTQIGETTGAGMIVDLEVWGDGVFASIRGGSVYYFKWFIKNALAFYMIVSKCPSPDSIFLVLLHIRNLLYAFTCDGAISSDGVGVSASSGIYGQYAKILSEADALGEIIINLATGNLYIGEQQTFTAHGQDTAGDSVKLDKPKWQATGGAISTSGNTCTYTATQEGQHQIICWNGGSTIVGKAKVNNILPVKVKEAKSPLFEYNLAQNYPNPFNPVTTIAYSVKEKCHVRLQVFDILGRKLATLVDKEQATGAYSVPFNAGQCSSGVLFYRIQMKEFTAIKKMVLVQ